MCAYLRTWTGGILRASPLGVRRLHTLENMVKAVQTHFQGASWQRCQTHFIRNLLDACPKALQEEFHGRLRLVFDAPDLATARRLKDDLVRLRRSGA